MAEEFQAGVCGGNWWNNSTRGGGVFGSSPCSSVMITDIGSYGGWPSSTHDHLVMNTMKDTKSSDESSDGSMVIFQDLEKPPQSGGAAVDSTTLQIMGIGVSSSTTSTPSDWNQSLLRDGNYNYSEDSSIDAIKAVANNHSYSLVHPPLNFITSSGDCTSTFPISANTSPYPSNYPSSLLQSLFDSNSPPQYDNGSSMTYMSDYRTNLGDFSSTPMPKFPQPSLVRPKSELVSGGLHLSNNTPYWNTSAAALNDIRASFFTSTQSQFMSSTYEEKPNCTNITNSKDSSSSVKKSCSEPVFKRPRLETPSPLPTFKVRKEKLGDRVTALQQLVSPFGKTDTASVLHEAIEYIKLLHDQVNVLSTPYMKNGASMQRQQISDKVKDKEGAQPDLRSRGLCLVPVSSTFPVTTETTADFWTPSFGGTFR